MTDIEMDVVFPFAHAQFSFNEKLELAHNLNFAVAIS